MIGHYRRNFLNWEFGFTAFASLGIVIWGEVFDGFAIINRILHQNRAATYAALASVFGSLLGFAIAAVAIALSVADSERMRVVRESAHYHTLWKIFRACIRVLSAGTVLSLAALVVDRDSTPERWVLYALLASTLLAAARMARVVWLLEKIIAIVAHKQK